MTSLLEHVLDANGAARFASVSTITATVEYGGTFWDLKGHPSFAGSAVVEARAHEQWIRQTDVVGGRQMIFDRSLNRIMVMDRNGEVIEELHDPRRTFGGYTQRSPWTEGQMAYFRCYTTWHYLVEPFVFAFPGTTSGEIDEHAEHGEHWRGLCVTFPEDLDSHNQTQLYYFDDAYHLRRTDLQPEVNDYSPTTQYVEDQVEVDGITVPTKRRVHTRRLDRSPDTRRTPLTVDLRDIQFS
ncbi:hypothetical protein [Agromyces sp. NPDC057865]|uniref:hypothetical protein n=1 Tax=Agromyces sp. NPDC057865 TaxID=3346267 RepID=UPI00366C3668